MPELLLLARFKPPAIPTPAFELTFPAAPALFIPTMEKLEAAGWLALRELKFSVGQRDELPEEDANAEVVQLAEADPNPDAAPMLAPAPKPKVPAAKVGQYEDS